MTGQGAECGAFARGKEAFGERAGVDFTPNLFDVNAQWVVCAHRDQRQFAGVGDIELQTARILFRLQLRFAAGQIVEADLGRRNAQVVAKYAAKRRAATRKMNPVFLEAETPGARRLVGREVRTGQAKDSRYSIPIARFPPD